MKVNLYWGSAALAAALTWTAFAQEPESTDAGFRLERVPHDQARALDEAVPDEAVSDGFGDESFDRAAWRRRLLDSDLDRREESYDRMLREHASDDAKRDALRSALSDWAADESEPALAWTSRLALRELSGARRAQPQTPRDADLHGRPADPFDGLLRRHFGGTDPFGTDLFRLDPFGGGAFGGRTFGPGTVDEYLDSVREHFDALRKGVPLQDARSSSKSLRIQMGPDGVRVERDEDVDGECQTHVYEADDLEALLEAHPELKEQVSIDPFGGSRGGVEALRPFRRLLPAPSERDESIRDPFAEDDGSPSPLEPVTPGPVTSGDVPTHYLGVMMQEPSAEDVRSGRRDVGLRVQSTLPGTIAAELGVEAGDLLIELDGRRLYGAADVRAALAAREPGAALELVLVDAEGVERTLTWKPGSR